VQTEIEEFNPGTYLPHLPRWLTTGAQCQDKAASAMVLTLASKDSLVKALSKVLSLFGRQFKVQHYLTFSPDTQYNKYMAFSHHTAQCTGQIHYAICSQEYPTHLHTCSRSDCPTKGKLCLHTTIQCTNYKDSHQVTSQEC
ncbi:hypothetical protein L873DRAFT_1636803, partial [Choiromyces venosus 120613-1]